MRKRTRFSSLLGLALFVASACSTQAPSPQQTTVSFVRIAQVCGARSPRRPSAVPALTALNVPEGVGPGLLLPQQEMVSSIRMPQAKSPPALTALNLPSIEV